MKKLTAIASLSLLMMSSAVFASANHKVIYGTDSRQEVADYHDVRFQVFAQSVAAMVSSGSLEKETRPGARGSVFTFDDTVTLADTMKACQHERFAEQPSLASCTGFLVGEDTLVTAGHCVESMADCRGNKWVFGFKDGVTSFSEDDVYRCVGIEGQANALGIFSQRDYAVLKLDRKVKDRKPLKYRTRGRISLGEELVVIGHPSGLPMKIADNAQARRNRINFFYANTDTYGGNSGSPVFNRRNGQVEGILIRSRAGSDYERRGSCYVSRYVDYSSAREMIHRITRVPEIQ